MRQNDPLPNSSGSWQIAKYGSYLHELPCVRVVARCWMHRGAIGVRAAIGLDLGKQ